MTTKSDQLTTARHMLLEHALDTFAIEATPNNMRVLWALPTNDPDASRAIEYEHDSLLFHNEGWELINELSPVIGLLITTSGQTFATRHLAATEWVYCLNRAQYANLFAVARQLAGLPELPAFTDEQPKPQATTGPAFYDDTPPPQATPGPKISVHLGELSLRELLAFSRGCVLGHQAGLDLVAVRTAGRLVNESENVDSTEQCRDLAGKIARELLTDVVAELVTERHYHDGVPF